MKHRLILLVLLMLSACAQFPQREALEAKEADKISAISKNSETSETSKITETGEDTGSSPWREVEPEQLVLMTLPQGQVVIALAPQFSPRHVERFTQLVRDGFYDGMPFNRVIDGFVAQAGPEAVSDEIPALKLEGHWPIDNGWQFFLAQAPDMFAPQTGFKDGFAVGVDQLANQAWLLHCPGVIGLGRNNQPDTASSHFYITIGQAPRYLDRIMSLFGRVIYGLEHLQSLQRTQVIEGETEVASESFTPIVNMRLMSDLANEKRIRLAVQNTQHPTFINMLAERRHRSHPFFYKPPPPVLDVCQVPMLTKRL